MSLETKHRECPICHVVGEPGVVRPGRSGSKVHHFTCKNENCRWFDTGWIVQVMPDGTVPEREPGPKEVEPLSVYDKAQAQRFLDQIMQEDVGGMGPQ